MGFPSLDIVDLLDIIYTNFIHPTLSSWGVITFAHNSYSWLEDLIYYNIPFTGAFKRTVFDAVIFTLKFISLIAMLVFIRGGIPRYRYDFLTKIGWIKFLSLVIAVFLSSLLLVLLV